MTPKNIQDVVAEKVQEFEIKHGQYTSHDSREDAKNWLRTTPAIKRPTCEVYRAIDEANQPH